MRNITITLAFILLNVICLGQTKTDKYILRINFEPSFISTSQLIINSNPDSSFIELKISKKSNEDKVLLKQDDLKKLTSFLNYYKFQIKSSFDTVSSNKDGSVTVSTGTDGITVIGTFDQNNKQKKFQFWSPKKGTQNHKLIIILFDLLNRLNMNKNSIEYLKGLKEYFNQR